MGAHLPSPGRILLLCLGLWAGLACAGAPPDWLDQARRLIEQKDLEGAKTVLDKGLGSMPDNAAAHYELAVVLIGLGRHDAAVRELEAARRLAPDDLDTLWLLGREYEDGGAYDKALEIYDRIESLAGDDAELRALASHRRRYVVATQHARQGDLATAREMFARLSREDPNDILSLYSLGVAQMLGGLPDEALATFERVIDKSPDYLNAYLNIARIEQIKGQFDKAAAALRKVVDLSPDGSPERRAAQTELGLIEARLLAADGNLEAALEIYVTIIEQMPQELRALLPAARIAERLGMTKRAIALYRQALARRPADPESRLALARLELQSGQIEAAFGDAEAIDESRLDAAGRDELRRLRQAIARTPTGQGLLAEARKRRLAELREALVKRPDDPELLREIARLELLQRDWTAALPHLQSLRDLEPFDPWPHIALATAYDQLGRFMEAAEQYAWLIMLERDENAVRQYILFLRLSLGKALYAAGQRRPATEVFNAVLGQDPDNLIARCYLGLIYTQEEAMMKAVENYRRIIAIMPSHVGARLNLAAVYARMNREEDALAEYRKLLAARPPEAVARVARERMDQIEKRLRGLTGNLSYALTYDGNSNLNRTRTQEELRSDLGLNLDYRYKMANGLRWRLNLNPAYANFHYSQFDFINLSTTVSADVLYRGATLLAGVTRRTSRGLVTSRRSSESNTLFGEALKRLPLPDLLRLATGERVPTNLQLDASLTEFQSTSSAFFDARTLSLSGEIAQPVADRSMAHLRYTYVKNNNSELVGSDYAYRSHSIGLRLERGYLRAGVVNLQYRFTLLDYLHRDSSTRFTRRRRNTRQSLTIGTSYAVDEALSVFANASWELNDSNLPVGLILNTEDIIEGQQSSSLGDYRRGTIGAGVRLDF